MFRADLEEKLDGEGQAGWELCQIIFEKEDIEGTMHLIFKKEIEKPET